MTCILLSIAFGLFSNSMFWLYRNDKRLLLLCFRSAALNQLRQGHNTTRRKSPCYFVVCCLRQLKKQHASDSVYASKSDFGWGSETIHSIKIFTIFIWMVSEDLLSPSRSPPGWCQKVFLGHPNQHIKYFSFREWSRKT